MSHKSQFDDIGLVPAEAVPKAWRWLAIFGVSVLLTGIPYVVYTWCSPVLYSAAMTQDVMNQQSVVSYILKGGCKVVLVGSSMIYAVREDLFQTPVCNIGLPGDGAATGFGILERFEKTPRVIIVEINALRDVNKELVGMLDIRLPWWRDLMLKMKMGPRFTDVFDWNGSRSAAPNEGKRLSRQELQSVLSSAPQDSERLRRESPNRQYNGPIGEEVQEFYASFARSAAVMERRGARVFFVNLPVAENKDDMILVMERYSPGLTIQPKVDIRELRWVDSTHLDERSAALYAAALEPYFSRSSHEVGR